MRDKMASAAIHPDNYQFLQEHVHARAGIVLGEDKNYLFESRLAPIVDQLGLGSINDLCALLRATRDTQVGRQVAEAMTTNETYFFRDPDQYDAVRTVLLPRLKEDRRATRNLRFWSAAASTGQEAYSLAMLLWEHGVSGWDIEILGTDFSTRVLECARRGRFHPIEVSRGLPPALLHNHFHRSGVDWQLNEPVRRMARFETLDLRQSLRSHGPFDLVLCRNVLIYFDFETRRNVLKELHRTLAPGGWLLLGSVETASAVDELFVRQQVGSAAVYVAR